MTDPRNMTDSELEYVIRDCANAISAYPTSRNTRRYANEIIQCEAEIEHRMEEDFIKERKEYREAKKQGKSTSTILQSCNTKIRFHR